MLSLISLGGTISMTSDKNGALPSLNAQDLAKEFKDIRAITFSNIASPNITFSMLLELLELAKEEVNKGSKAIIITQGTDTLEESAFFIQSLWKSKIPIVFCAAMKHSSQLGSDYLANINDAIITAKSAINKDLGVLCVLNSCIHSANFIHKSNTFSLDTFTSFDFGLVGKVIEGKAYFYKDNIKRYLFNSPKKISKKVGLLKLCLDCDDDILEYYLNNYDALVFSGYGAGHLMQRHMKYIKNIKKPLIMASRCESGKTGFNTYAYLGAEISLRENGVIMSAFISDVKARILTLLALENNIDLKELFTKDNIIF